ncbi:dihydroorotate dehydrogenase B (NAD(+)), electron transfer subunit [Oxobacter pfennigii]|uniref:Dihydroorotate dehydrogenase B (NAD(+)), electron transfer subunit n=1 Tax=Oxobacter pfennigii TaxID=36849 RepID=A0A0P8YSR7_9CLOT|nr:dihydroorotate dehydrogenase electron transfer subunit [Oxobacter pfennigii]KPU42725.1 dihydroorotate dehydrogenase B (NAD(+)), electron transfer subunit [Oxobacter pfennigii]
MISYHKYSVCENEIVSKGIYKLSVKGSFEGKPGQFYMLRAWGTEPILSRPISIHDKIKDKISFLYEVKGRGTVQFSSLDTGDEIELLGPLGNGFDLSGLKGKVALVAGGIGVAPMFYTAKELKGVSLDLYAGFRDDTYIIEDFRKYVDSIKFSTDTGKSGHKGFITDIFDPSVYSSVLCCGPEIMMKKVVEMCNAGDVPVYISMEKHMACGIGACLVCACKTREGNKRACKDGPVFNGKDVLFDA